MFCHFDLKKKIFSKKSEKHLCEKELFSLVLLAIAEKELPFEVAIRLVVAVSKYQFLI